MTGAGRGIGRATALALTRRGARVALVSRSRDELVETATLVAAAGGEAFVVPGDLSDTDQLGDIAQRTVAALGTVDIVINNAAMVAPLGASVGLEPGAWAATIGLNVTAVATLTFALLPPMLDQGWGRVVNVSSGIAARPASMIGGNAYATSKAALEAHTVNLAAELAGTGVTANVFRPGIVDTAMQTWIRTQDPERIGAGLHERFNQFHDQGMLISPEQCAESLAARLVGEGNGEIWDVTDAL